jgi:hypothetical protein
MTQPIASIIHQRRQALISMWVFDPLIQVQVETPAALPGLVFLDGAGDGAGVSGLGRRSLQKVAMVSRPGNPDRNASVWVASPHSGYRGAYLAFLKAAYGVAAKPGDLAGYDVDHLLNRARAPQDTTFVRVEAVEEAVNRAWGGLFEKAASNPDFFANRARERRTMSWAICAKLAGQMPPSGPHDVGGINRLAQFFQSVGLNRQEASDGVANMLRFAYSLG